MIIARVVEVAATTGRETVHMVAEAVLAGGAGTGKTRGVTGAVRRWRGRAASSISVRQLPYGSSPSDNVVRQMVW